MRRKLLLPFAAIIAMATSTTAFVDPCKGESDTSFQSQVRVEFGMAHDEGLTSEELSYLGDAFVDAYNSRAVVSTSNEINCDIDLRRHIESCEVEALDSLYLFENGNKIYRRIFKFECDARCIECDRDQSLLDYTPETRRQLLNSLSEDPDQFNRELLFFPLTVEAGQCQCHEDAEIRGPSQQEMKDALRVEVDNKKQQNQLHAVKSVINVVQMEHVACSPKEEEFETVVVVKFSDDPSPLDLYALANGFLDSYNEESTNYCDPYHSRITGVTIQNEGVSRRRLRKRVAGKKRRIFNIGGASRRPRKKLFRKIFDQVSDRRTRGLNEEEEPEDEESWTDTCSCPKYPIARRTLTESEFKTRYNRSVQETNNVQVTSVKEVVS